MANLLSQKISNIQKLYDDISKYTTDIQIKKANIDLSIDIDQELDDMHKTLETLHKLDAKSMNLELAYKIWHLISLTVYKIDYIIDELNELSSNIRITAEMSDTHITLIGNLFNNITNIYNKHQKDATTLDTEIIDTLSKNSDMNLKNSNQNADLIKEYPFAISLFAYIMQKTLDANPSQSDKISIIVENVKDYILTTDFVKRTSKSSAKSKKPPSKLYSQNPHIKTFGLTPYGPAKSLSDLSGDIFPSSGKPDKLSVSKLSAMAKSKNVCIVMMNRVTRKPIEFSLWKLMDWKYAKPFLQGAFADGGINKTIVDRFETIYFTQDNSTTIKPLKWNFEIAYYGDLDKSSEFIVLENMGSGLYRLLTLYIDSTSNYNGGGKLDTKIPRDKIPEFIEYVRAKGVINGETRSSKYHRIQEREIMKNIFLPIKFNIEGINLGSQIVDSKFLRNELYIRLVKRCHGIIEKEYKNAEKIKTHKDLGQIIHDKELSDIFNSIIVEQYDLYTFKKKENVSNFAFSETLKTFLSQLHLLNRDFIRNMHDNFVATRIDNKIFEDNRTKNIFARKLCEDIIKTTLEKMISNESNIYQGLIYKTSLLKLSVV
jgi:hypothetical protein